MTLHISAESALALAMALNGVTTSSLEQRRAVAAEVIEDLISFLDDTEGDCDLEAQGDENDCSWPEGCRPIVALCEDDEDDDPKEDEGCSEPWLASPEIGIEYGVQDPASKRWTVFRGSQDAWAAGSANDAEEANEDGGDILDEPHDGIDEGNEEGSLGWPHTDINQLHACGQAVHQGEDGGWEAA